MRYEGSKEKLPSKNLALLRQEFGKEKDENRPDL